jgi:hypothetical protein
MSSESSGHPSRREVVCAEWHGGKSRAVEHCYKKLTADKNEQFFFIKRAWKTALKNAGIRRREER